DRFTALHPEVAVTEVAALPGDIHNLTGGGGLAASVISTWGYSGGYYLAGGIAFLSALITLLLRQPGRPADQERPAVQTVADSRGLTGAAS
ncbi:hypothetical protein ACWD60_38655, partial [Streptomyces sp. NPDC005167]